MNALKDFFEKLAQEWDDNQPQDRVQTINALLEPFDAHFLAARTLLDVGTGTGAIIPILSQRYPQAKIISIDFAHQMCQRATLRPSITCVAQGDVHALPFQNQVFDAVICHNSFPHFFDKPRAIRNMARVLKQAGSILILHDISRDRVNEIHQNARAHVIHNDLLPESNLIIQMLLKSQLVPEILLDTDTHFIIYAKSG